ncbi:MAG: hypothetical protein GH147_07855 [Clostridia bacterium]|nr:hypothetical protein [Clostridia bacterium]
MEKIYLLLSIFILSSLCSNCLRAEEIMVNGQASAWVGYSEDLHGGIRYIPELMVSHRLTEGSDIDGDISLNAYIFDEDNDLKLYRLWARYATSQLEMRLGLQKINFGPAKVLRSLMWFDQVDVRDPLGLTDGVYGLLGRYYFLNNANIWVWGLYGNDELKGLETFKTDEDRLEFGGRFQHPVPRGEIAFSFHRRYLDSEDWKRKMAPRPELAKGSENRYGIDGNWDIGVGLWFEAVVGKIKINRKENLWEEFLTVGTDYTFAIGPGIHTLFEHFIESSGPEVFEQENVNRFSALSIDFSVTLLDSVNAIWYYDWRAERIYTYFDWQRTYDNWMVNLSIFSSRKDETGMYGGTGVQCMFTYNH